MLKGATVRSQVRRSGVSRRHRRRRSTLNVFINECSQEESSLGKRPKNAENILHGAKIAIKDNICTFDCPTTCGSNALRSYVSPYDATVIARLRNAGALLVGKTNLDEFGMGSHSIHSAFAPVKTHEGHSPGGSSGGSAVAVASGQAEIALGTDTGGSVRLPAAYNSIFGFKPSYGRLSRWGVVAYANSLDTVGILSKTAGRIRRTFDHLDEYDQKDPTSLGPATRSRLSALLITRQSRTALRIGVPKEYNISELSAPVRDAWFSTLQHLYNTRHEIHAISLPSTRQALSAYYVLAPAEASSNLAKYDSVRYGSRPECSTTNGPLYSNARQQGFGEEVRRRILLGAYTLSADAIDNYFIQAQKVRRIVQQDFDAVLALPNVLRDNTGEYNGEGEGVDAIICPTAPTLPPMLNDVLARSPVDAYADDVFTVPASLAGLPAISVPVTYTKNAQDTKKDNSQIGLQIITQYGDDHLALSIAERLEELGN